MNALPLLEYSFFNAAIKCFIPTAPLPSEAASAIGTFFLTYFTFYLAGAFVISFESQDIISCFTVSAALLNNTGAAVESSISYADVSPVMHILMSVLMLAGRLELYTVLLPFSRSDKF